MLGFSPFRLFLKKAHTKKNLPINNPILFLKPKKKCKCYVKVKSHFLTTHVVGILMITNLVNGLKYDQKENKKGLWG